MNEKSYVEISDANGSIRVSADVLAELTSAACLETTGVSAMIRVLRHRWPMARVLVCPVRVQGEGAAEEIAAMRPLVYSDLSRDAAHLVHFLDDEQVLNDCDAILVVGGDGTILKIADQASIHQKPVLGINCGTIGFMEKGLSFLEFNYMTVSIE